ncbi:5-methylthioadenosine/S-adenosylhomocysteine deaminase [Clostridia bacterium]|nr:5-methylthioadenosine/S-adenosylhomocysteine deaminase [Clostridia bacterium]
MNILIKNVTAVLPEGVREKVNIAITGDVITAVWSGTSVISGDLTGFTPERTIDGGGKLAFPGLVNCHTHAYMTLFRNLADDLTFDEWLFRSVMPLEDVTTGEDAYWGSLLGYAEMLKTGTTSFADMHMFTPFCAAAADKIGIRGVMTRGLVGNGRNDEGGLRRIAEFRQEAEKYKDHPRLTFMVAPHAVYTTDREYLELCAETAKEAGVSVNIHVSETLYEVSSCKEAHGGLSPVEYIEKTGLFDVNAVAAHCVHLSERDMDILAEKRVNVAANPKSNLKLANGTAPVPELLKKGVNVCIGTDGAASNNALNMFSEMNFSALLHKGRLGDPTVTGAAETFRMATAAGAKALQINAGEIAAGKKADIVLSDLARPQFCPKQNLVAALVYSANGSEVETVIVDGEIVLENGRLTRLDENEVMRKANESLKRIKERAGK